MPKKKSVKKCSQQFRDHADEVVEFAKESDAALGKKHTSWAYDYAVIRLYREFESLVFDALVGAINNDTSTISSRTGYSFPDHLNQDVCRYLIVGSGYFDFRGRDGLIKTIKGFVPDDHYLLTVVKKQNYKLALERLTGLRNFAAHASQQSKNSALAATSQERMSSAGAWLKVQNRLPELVNRLKELAQEIEDGAPY